jgi:hypothetical protein
VWKVRYSRLNYCVLCGGIILYTGAFGRCSCSALPAHRVAVVITNRCGSSVGLRALRSRARRAELEEPLPLTRLPQREVQRLVVGAKLLLTCTDER